MAGLPESDELLFKLCLLMFDAKPAFVRQDGVYTLEELPGPARQQ
jgi:hypothetical protein